MGSGFLRSALIAEAACRKLTAELACILSTVDWAKDTVWTQLPQRYFVVEAHGEGPSTRNRKLAECRDLCTGRSRLILVHLGGRLRTTGLVLPSILCAMC